LIRIYPQKVGEAYKYILQKDKTCLIKHKYKNISQVITGGELDSYYSRCCITKKTIFLGNLEHYYNDYIVMELSDDEVLSYKVLEELVN